MLTGDLGPMCVGSKLFYNIVSLGIIFHIFGRKQRSWFYIRLYQPRIVTYNNPKSIFYPQKCNLGLIEVFM